MRKGPHDDDDDDDGGDDDDDGHDDDDDDDVDQKVWRPLCITFNSNLTTLHFGKRFICIETKSKLSPHVFETSCF